MRLCARHAYAFVLCWIMATPVIGRSPQVNALTASDFVQVPYDDSKDQPWQEDSLSLPAFPQENHWQEVYVSATARARAFIDTATLTLGQDGVLRYVLLIKAAGGARNISFEGMRCATGENRLYAVAAMDNTWRLTSNDWQRIEFKAHNPYHASLARYYFCSDAEGVPSLSRVRHLLQQPLRSRVLP